MLIHWIYQDIQYPLYFDDIINTALRSKKYILIPIGIEESSQKYHLNILFWDIKKKTVERFEPMGAIDSFILNYNPQLLDLLLEKKIKTYDYNIKYYNPKDYLPTIGVQLLEELEDTIQSNDTTNGFCVAWCFWWVYNRIKNINTHSNSELGLALIQQIKLDNLKFKEIIKKYILDILNFKKNILLTNNLTDSSLVYNYNILQKYI
jgi:hypothetical protein